MTNQLDGKINDIPGIAEGIASVDNTLEEIIQYTKKSEAILTGPRDDIDLEESTHIISSIRGLANSKNEDGNINIEFLSQEVVKNALNVSFQLEKIIKNLGNKWENEKLLEIGDVDPSVRYHLLEAGLRVDKYGLAHYHLKLNGKVATSFTAEFYVLEPSDERYDEMNGHTAFTHDNYGRGPKSIRKNYGRQMELIKYIENECLSDEVDQTLVINVKPSLLHTSMSADEIKLILRGRRPKMNSYGNGDNRNPRGN